jgi:hypothetical protein
MVYDFCRAFESGHSVWIVYAEQRNRAVTELKTSRVFISSEHDIIWELSAANSKKRMRQKALGDTVKSSTRIPLKAYVQQFKLFSNCSSWGKLQGISISHWKCASALVVTLNYDQGLRISIGARQRGRGRSETLTCDQWLEIGTRRLDLESGPDTIWPCSPSTRGTTTELNDNIIR